MKKTNVLQNRILCMGATLALVLNLGCSGKNPFDTTSDPFTEYEGLDQKSMNLYEPGTPPPPQVTAPNPLQLQGGTLYNREFLNFVEGEKGFSTIGARSFLAGVKLDLQAEGLPAEASMARDEKNKDIWVVQWTPAAGTVDKNSNQRQIDLKVNFLPKHADGTPLDPKKYVNDQENHGFYIMVRVDKDAPLIEKISNLPFTVNETEKIIFTVNVYDPSSEGKSAEAPQLMSGSENSYYSGAVSAEDAIDFETEDVKSLGNGRWQFTLSFNASVVAEKNRSSAKEGALNSQFSIQVASAKGASPSITYSQYVTILMNEDTKAGGQK